MRIDILTIFPDYLAPLDLSLVGKARRSGLLDIEIHDLRTWAPDRHRTVDDTPYGGGAGMVMRPQPWGQALDSVTERVPDSGAMTSRAEPLLVVPTPSGEPLSQPLAEELAGQPWLVVACGRYEGIDQRVTEDARRRMRVVEVSLGDYVLNGGEAAALVLVETVARLLPGFVGNPESLAEESHDLGGDGRLLEYPVFTKPPVWRGLEVPPVLLSGDHEAVARWRRDEAVRRTAQRRPDLQHPSVLLTLSGGLAEAAAEIRMATPADAGEILTLQRACWAGRERGGSEAELLGESLRDVVAWLAAWHTLVLRASGRLVAAGRGRGVEDQWHIGRLMVAPDLRHQGLGMAMLVALEAAAPKGATGIELDAEVDGPWASARVLRALRKAGYRACRSPDDAVRRLRKRLV